MINPNTQAKYLDNPEQCPFCNSEHLAGGSLDFTCAKTIVRQVECLDCRKNWMESFNLASISE